MNRESRRHRERELEETEQAQAVPTGAIERERSSPAEFLREVRAEMKKVAWPTRREVINYSVVVLIVTAVLTLLTWAMDWTFRQATVNFFG